MIDELHPPGTSTPVDRHRLEALRYGVNDEAVQDVAIMRAFTVGLAGLLSDQSAVEIRDALTGAGIDVDLDTVDLRLPYFVEHGNLARSPRETEARTLAEYLRNRARYQLTQRGELVHRHVEDLLGPDRLAREITTVFAQFNELVHSTREFYTYVTRVLARFDLDRGEFQLFKSALIDYLQRFVDEISRHMPQIAQVVDELASRVPLLCARVNAGERLLDLEGRRARRTPGLDPVDWQTLRAWFSGDGSRSRDADEVRHLATSAMRALLTNLRRIATSTDREHGRYADLTRLAAWFDTADDDTAHALWASAFGLYGARHLGFAADDVERPVPPTTSWWAAPAAEVPVMLRSQGQRAVVGRSARREDFTAAKMTRLAERDRAERERRAAIAEVVAHQGRLDRVRLGDPALEVLLELYAAALAAGVDGEPAASIHGAAADLVVHPSPGRGTLVTSPSGRLTLVGRTLAVRAETAGSGSAPSARAALG